MIRTKKKKKFYIFFFFFVRYQKEIFFDKHYIFIFSILKIFFFIYHQMKKKVLYDKKRKDFFKSLFFLETETKYIWGKILLYFFLVIGFYSGASLFNLGGALLIIQKKWVLIQSIYLDKLFHMLSVFFLAFYIFLKKYLNAFFFSRKKKNNVYNVIWYF